jgi:flavin-dependent dehydrogenase
MPLIMPVRATKRGAERTPLSGDRDVLICGASFAGLTIARELAGSGARVLVIDRYEIGEKQTSACAAPTAWLENMGVAESILQTVDGLVVGTPFGEHRYPMPHTFSTFDYRRLCELLWAQCGEAEFDTAKVEGRTGHTVHTDRGDLTAPLVIDGLGWRRVLSHGPTIQPPEATLSRGLEVHPEGEGEDLRIWVDRRYLPEGYAWDFPAGGERRIGIGSFDPGFKVKEPTQLIAADRGAPAVGYQGNYIPHKLRRAVEDGIFFVGDSAGHCLPLSAEGIRTAFYFGIACGRELNLVLDGRQTREQALERYGAFSDEHEWKFRWLLHFQRLVPRVPPRLLDRAIDWMSRDQRFVDWLFRHYLDVAPPGFAVEPADARPHARAAEAALAAA